MADETAITQEAKRKKVNKHRLQFLALLLALGGTISLLMKRELHIFLGQLTQIASSNKKLTSAQMGVVRAFVKGGMARLARDVLHQAEAVTPEVTRLATEMSGGVYDPFDTDVLYGTLNTGAMGVPLSDVLAQQFLQGINGINGAVQRTILSDSEIVVAVPEIQAIFDRMIKKVNGEVETQINDGFNTVVQQTAIKVGVKEMLYHLSPTDTHCKICPPRDGKIYPVNHEVWDSLPVHPNCVCWGEPIVRVQGEKLPL